MSIKRIVISALSLFGFISVFSQATLPADELAVRIADRIIPETPYTFINTQTNETYHHLKGVPFSMDIKVESKYNNWHYSNGVLQITLLELADKTADKKYEEYVLKNMHFVFDKDNLSFFERQFKEAFKEKSWRGIRNVSWHMIFRNKRLDDNGPMGASLIDVSMRMQKAEKRFIEYINTTDKHLMYAEPRLEDGTIARIWPHENTIWADDLFMALSFLCRMGKMSGDRKYFDDAANQVFNYHKYLWHPGKEIYYHCYHTDIDEYGVAHWSRANGWMLMAKADLLTMLPEDHPERDALIENFNQQVKGILRY
jgi:Predicted unsaturated glucuronyl hydrolase involved in regulation of bacterial surface properties, and related proteins